MAPAGVSSEIHVKRVGSQGPHLVMIHGFGGNGYTWSRWVDNLATDHQLHLIDVKGFGDAPRPRDGRYSLRDLAGPVAGYIQEMGLERVTLVGHSLGGAIALIVSLDLYERALRDGMEPAPARLVIVSGAAFPQRIPPFIRFAGSRAVGGVLLRIIPMRWLIRLALKKICYDSSCVRTEQVQAYADPIRRPGGRYAIRIAARQIVPKDAARIVEGYASLDVPTLLLWGRHDDVVPLSTAYRLESVLPRSKLAVLERCGHIPPEECPEDSLAVVRAFFRDEPVSA